MLVRYSCRFTTVTVMKKNENAISTTSSIGAMKELMLFNSVRGVVPSRVDHHQSNTATVKKMAVSTVVITVDRTISLRSGISSLTVVLTDLDVAKPMFHT